MAEAAFAVPAAPSPALAAVMDEWRALRRGEADIPFADDLDLVRMRALCEDILVLEAFETPRRFRLNLARTPNAPRVERELQGRFLDEIDLAPPLDELAAQAAATVQDCRPTYHRRNGRAATRGYARLLAPFWGEGQIRLLLGAIAWL